MPFPTFDGYCLFSWSVIPKDSICHWRILLHINFKHFLPIWPAQTMKYMRF